MSTPAWHVPLWCNACFRITNMLYIRLVLSCTGANDAVGNVHLQPNAMAACAARCKCHSTHLRRDAFALATGNLGHEGIGGEIGRGHDGAVGHTPVGDVQPWVRIVAAINDAPRVSATHRRTWVSRSSNHRPTRTCNMAPANHTCLWKWHNLRIQDMFCYWMMARLVLSPNSSNQTTSRIQIR